MENYSVSNQKKDLVLIYYKMRDPKDLQQICEFFEKKKVTYKIIKYGSYIESDYQKLLDRSQYVFWLGCHESQGFALQAALAKNIPVLVWSVQKLSQEWKCSPSYFSIKTKITTVPYWDDTCGLKFYNFSELEDSFEKFVSNLSNYKPRGFIEKNLSVTKCSKRFLKLITKTRETMTIKSQELEKKSNILEKFKTKILDIF